MYRIQVVYRMFVVAVMAMTLLAQAVAPVRAADLNGGPAEGLADLVKKIINGMIIAGGIILAFFIGFTNLSALIARGAGLPHVEATATLKIISMVALFGFLVFTIAISNAFVDGIMAYHPKDSIHVPQP